MPPNDTFRVICENCAQTDWTAITIGVVGAILAFCALIYAGRAFKVAKDTLDLTEKQHALAQAQHDLDRQQFEQGQTERTARARFRLSVDVDNRGTNDAGAFMTNATVSLLRLRIGIDNVGTRAAGATTVNVRTRAVPPPAQMVRCQWREYREHPDCR